MKKYIWMTMAALMCFSGIATAQQKKVVKKASPNTVVEVLYFHGKQRCPTCISIGDNSIDVVNKDFAKQLKSGQVKFREIDISTPDGEKIADLYHVTWSSLYVNQWKNGKENRNDMTRFGFENARNNTEAFRSGLKNKINQLLK
ncbi:MAG: nitrophenyl compound nitroreductase subunit ArsF family protein [Bacteroidales bacterium]|nr:nitrophenyl compound nitroreductase subunit ArsF family protein [Bacteroidales bacterium]MDD4420879.1 nitrophenyl compound nitroreductase subunit ArsF family protein [Bacteroidales bacterium]